MGEPASGLFRREDFLEAGGYDERWRYFVDLEFWLKLLRRGDAWWIDRPLYRFRIHRRGASAGSRSISIDEFIRLNESYRDLSWFEKSMLRLKARTVGRMRDTVIRLLG